MTQHIRRRLLPCLIGSFFMTSASFAQDASSAARSAVDAGAGPALAEGGADPAPVKTEPAPTAPQQRPNPSSTSNTTTSNDTQRGQELSAVIVNGKAISLGGGLMSVQTAPKAVSTVTRDAIEKAAPGSNFVQLISSIPGVYASSDDATGLADGNFCIRGFCSGEIGATVNGAPIPDSGNYAIYATEYGDAANVGDITVLQGIPDVDMPDTGASGGHIGWATIDPSHDPGIDFEQSFGSNDYRRTFVRLNTGDTGPVRSWISYSDNSADKWRGKGDLDVTKIDAKSIWTIDDLNSISASAQYNREVKYLYYGVTRSQVAEDGYHTDYDTTYAPGSLDTNYYKLHVNPFRSLMVSLDGEFTLTPSLHLSVIPYFQYGDGGSGSGNKYFQESTGTTNEFENANQDLNGDGQIVDGTKVLAYPFSHSTTYRPGVIAKFNQDLSATNSLEYGIWYEAPRQQQSQTIGIASATGEPGALWGDSNYIYYPDGRIQKVYDEYTDTDTGKLFVTDTWTFTDQWTAELGAAYLHVKREGFDYEYPGSQGGYNTEFGNPDVSATFNKVLPTFGLKFAPDDRNQFFYGVGKSFRAPPNVAIALNQVVGVDANKPESAWNNDLGWRYYGDRFSISTMLYRSNFNNKTESGYDQETGQTVYTQIGRLRMQGFDAEASYNFTDALSLYANYAYTDAKIESDLPTKDDGYFPTKGKTLFNTPRNQAYVRLGYDQGPLWAGLSAHYRGPIWGDYMNTEKVGGYTSVGFDAGYRFADWSDWLKKPFIKLNVSNLFDRHAFAFAINNSSFIASNPDHLVGLDGQTLYASAPYYSLLETRSVMVTIGASFF